MPVLSIREIVTYAGTAYERQFTVTGDNQGASQPVASIPAAKPGVLTTRTDANTGSLTMESGHGITTGARLDLFWSGGSRYGMVVGTVADLVVPIDLGTGDDLPNAATAITAMVPHEEVVAVVGNNATGAIIYSNFVAGDGYGYVVFLTSGDVHIAVYRISGDRPSDSWDGPTVATNPFAGVTVGKFLFSHGNLSTKMMGAAILYN